MDSSNYNPSDICSVCHTEPPVNAVRTDCGHIFCYMCIKSAAERSGCCPLCRAEIGIEFNFQRHQVLGALRVPTSSSGFYWFYEGYQGWWLYDADTNNFLEDAYNRGERCVQRFIAGFIYTIDMNSMTQKQSGGGGRARRICRDTIKLENILGIAGLMGTEISEALEWMREANESWSQALWSQTLTPIETSIFCDIVKCAFVMYVWLVPEKCSNCPPLMRELPTHHEITLNWQINSFPSINCLDRNLLHNPRPTCWTHHIVYYINERWNSSLDVRSESWKRECTFGPRSVFRQLYLLWTLPGSGFLALALSAHVAADMFQISTGGRRLLARLATTVATTGSQDAHTTRLPHCAWWKRDSTCN